MKMNDDAHQLTSVAASRPSDAARYRYDAAGNPVDRAELGLDVTNSFNNLNQIVSGSWTGSTVTVAGSVNYPLGSISVNNTPGTVYPDSSFDVAAVAAVPGTNTLTATYTGPAFTNVPMTATDTSTVVLGDTAYTHDANGNLTSDATFLYQYDLANQLTNVIRKADNSVVLQCRYDALGRRVEAIRSDGTVDRYVYFPGSFLVLAVLDGNNAPKEFYTRGPDLSGTLDSAGGIGGILACTYASGPVLYHHADLMGNVIAITDFASTLTACFCYTPAGQLISCMGVPLCRYLFSSKEIDWETGLIYYGFRYYLPSCNRWLTRDIVLSDAVSYRFCKGNMLRYVDDYGMYGKDVHYYAIYRMTQMIPDVSERVAYYSEYPDEYRELDAIKQWKRGTFAIHDRKNKVNYMHNTQSLFHQLNGFLVSYEESCVRCCLRKIYRESNEDWEKGFALHALGDSYAHIKIKIKGNAKYHGGRGGPHGAGVYSPTTYGSGDRMYASGWGHGWDIKAPDLPRTRPDLALAFLKDAYQLMSGNDPSPATVAELWDLSRGRAKATKDIIPPFQKRQDLEIDEESIKMWMEKLRLCIEECH